MLPVLASGCPGWICYAEKTHPECLPYVSTVKSPQQIVGTVVKRWAARELGVGADEVFHATIMPCPDKKLEASRLDFFDEDDNARDVDIVLTTTEALALLEEETATETETAGGVGDETDMKNENEGATEGVLGAAAAVGMATLAEGKSSEHANGSGGVDGATKGEPLLLRAVQAAMWYDGDSGESGSTGGGGGADPTLAERASGEVDGSDERTKSNHASLPALVGATSSGGGSEGYLEEIFRFAAWELFGVRMEGALEYTQGRNSDFQEVCLYPADEAAKNAEAGEGGEGGGGGESADAKQQAGGDKAASRKKPKPTPLLRFARAYGFRNIQTIVRRLKTGKCNYDYVEIMACPSGMLNGGGQIRPKSDDVPRGPTETNARVKRLKATFHDRDVRDPLDNAACRAIYEQWIGDTVFSPGTSGGSEERKIEREREKERERDVSMRESMRGVNAL